MRFIFLKLNPIKLKIKYNKMIKCSRQFNVILKSNTSEECSNNDYVIPMSIILI